MPFRSRIWSHIACWPNNRRSCFAAVLPPELLIDAIQVERARQQVLNSRLRLEAVRAKSGFKPFHGLLKFRWAGFDSGSEPHPDVHLQRASLSKYHQCTASTPHFHCMTTKKELLQAFENIKGENPLICTCREHKHNSQGPQSCSTWYQGKAPPCKASRARALGLSGQWLAQANPHKQGRNRTQI